MLNYEKNTVSCGGYEVPWPVVLKMHPFACRMRDHILKEHKIDLSTWQTRDYLGWDPILAATTPIGMRNWVYSIGKGGKTLKTGLLTCREVAKWFGQCKNFQHPVSQPIINNKFYAVSFKKHQCIEIGDFWVKRVKSPIYDRFQHKYVKRKTKGALNG